MLSLSELFYFSIFLSKIHRFCRAKDSKLELAKISTSSKYGYVLNVTVKEGFY